MATLSLEEIEWSAPQLREWLGGDWGLLFSHPEDFENRGFENDRWIEVLRDEFRAHRVRPLACAPAGGGTDGGWVSELIRDYRQVALAAADNPVIDLPARRLRDDLLNMPTRFVLIVDEWLRQRAILTYGAVRNLVSPLDLLASIQALRSPHTDGHQRQIPLTAFSSSAPRS